MFSYLVHRRACQRKQDERRTLIQTLPERFLYSPTSHDSQILNLPVSNVVQNVQSGSLDPSQVLLAYSRKALRAHQATNCLTEIMIASAQQWAEDCNKKGPLAGMPVSLKDTVGVAGWDSCIGYSAWVGQPVKEDSPLVRLLRDAGAVPFVKTNVPITLLSYESTCDVFGATTNPHKKGYSPGGSTGGEAALLAFGGSRIGIGTDVAGSVRVPSHYSGTYAVKSSMHRFLKAGNLTSMPGQEGIPSTYSPMARTLDDLETFWKAIFSMRPWEYDHSCLAMPWRNIKLSTETGLKWGVMLDDGVVSPSPACSRALQIVVDVLKAHGQQVVNVNPPSPYEGLQIASQLLLADAGKTACGPIHTFETNDLGVRQAVRMFLLPRWLKRLYGWFIRIVYRDPIYAGLVENWHEKTVQEYYALIARREDYRKMWFDWWKKEELDFLITVPNALPALPHGGSKAGWKSCGYTFLFNLLDYSAGVLPITHVNGVLDKLSSNFMPKNAIEKGVYKMYDANKMDGLPVGVQVVGRRLQEEKVLEGMKFIEDLLRKEGKAYQLFSD